MHYNNIIQLMTIPFVGSQNHDGIGPAATRVIVDSLFSSRIKEIAKHFLTLPVSDEMGLKTRTPSGTGPWSGRCGCAW